MHWPALVGRYTKWRGGRLKRMVSAKHVVREGKYDSVTGLHQGWMVMADGDGDGQDASGSSEVDGCWMVGPKFFLGNQGGPALVHLKHQLLSALSAFFFLVYRGTGTKLIQRSSWFVAQTKRFDLNSEYRCAFFLA